MDKQLLAILACPKCKGSVSEADGGKVLFCSKCEIRYPVRNGIPVMALDEARALKSAGENFSGELPTVSFRVIDGPDSNMTFQIEMGTCRAIGRANLDENKTSVFNVDLALELDESTRRLVLQYINQQFRKSEQTRDEKGGGFGSFRRSPDVVFTDTSLSRIHAMLFYDKAGVGILDLVSKNGTYVNGKEIESKLLAQGDVIELGETTISYDG